MNIGQASKASGVSQRMIRHYEKIGLIPAATRRDSGYRDYSDADVHRLRFIANARDLGFPIEEIRKLLDLWSDRGRASSEVKALAESRAADLGRKADALQAMRRALLDLATHCHGDDRISPTRFAPGMRKRASAISTIAHAAIAAARAKAAKGTGGTMTDGGRSAGLTAEMARARLESDGPNELPRPRQRSILRIAKEVLREPMLALLLAGGVAYLLLGDLAEALILLPFATFSVLCRLCLALRCDVAVLTNGLPPHT